MAKIYKTAMGKALDMDRLKMSNEDSIAVGNMKTNAPVSYTHLTLPTIYSV